MPWYSVFIFIFCLELMVRKKLDENDFHHYYGISFESTSLKLPQLCLKFFCNNWEVLWQRNSKWRLTVEDFMDISIGTNYFLSKFLETNINRIVWKITYIITQVCPSKNITPRHFTCYCMLRFVSNKPSF